MSTFAMFSVVLTVAIFHISKINGMKDSDIENVLGQLYRGRISQRSPLDRSLERQEIPDDEYQQLVQNIARRPQVQIGYPYKDKDSIINEKDHRNKNSRFRKWPWTQYIYVKPAWLKSVFTPRKQSYFSDNMKYRDGNNDLGDYSKVYLVLNPDADITKSDVRDLSNMVSSVLKKPSAPRKISLKDRIHKKRRYKGFVIKDNRRRIRESKEMFAEQDSIERDFKPKRQRPRGDYGGGGRGRTAIPYIRHRGDIFEKE